MSRSCFMKEELVLPSEKYKILTLNKNIYKLFHATCGSDLFKALWLLATKTAAILQT